MMNLRNWDVCDTTVQLGCLWRNGAIEVSVVKWSVMKWCKWGVYVQSVCKQPFPKESSEV